LIADKEVENSPTKSAVCMVTQRRERWCDDDDDKDLKDLKGAKTDREAVYHTLLHLQQLDPCRTFLSYFRELTQQGLDISRTWLLNRFKDIGWTRHKVDRKSLAKYFANGIKMRQCVIARSSCNC
jgi:hypothetical protein